MIKRNFKVSIIGINLIVRLDVFAKGQVLQRVFVTTEHLVTSHHDPGLRVRGTHLGLPRQLAQAGHQGRRHLLRAALKESAAAAQEQSVACEHQLVLGLTQGM